MEFEKAKKFLKFCRLWDTRVTSLRGLAFRILHLLATVAIFLNMLLVLVQHFGRENKDVWHWIALANQILGILHMYAICAFFYFKRSKVEATLQRFEEFPEIDGLSENMIAAHEDMKKRCKKVVDAHTMFSKVAWIASFTLLAWVMVSNLQNAEEGLQLPLTPGEFGLPPVFEVPKAIYICVLRAATDNYFIVLMLVTSEKMKFLAECAPEALEPSPVTPAVTPLFQSWLNYRNYCNGTIDFLNENVGGIMHVMIQTYIFRTVLLCCGFFKFSNANPLSVVLAVAITLMPLHLYCRGGEAVKEAGEDIGDAIHKTMRQQILTGPGYQEGNMFDCICNLIQDTQPELNLLIMPGGSSALSKTYFVKVVQSCFHYAVTIITTIEVP